MTLQINTETACQYRMLSSLALARAPIHLPASIFPPNVFYYRHRNSFFELDSRFIGRKMKIDKDRLAVGKNYSLRLER